MAISPFRLVRRSLLRSLPLCAAVLIIAAASPVSASLIFDSIRYDGKVAKNATTGTEAHFTDVDLTSNHNGTLPAQNAALPSPLVAGNNLTTTLTEVNSVYGGMPARQAILTISTLSAPEIFNNKLNPNVPLPVTLDAVVYSDVLGTGEGIDVKAFTIENNLPPVAPGSQVITGIGNPALPLGSPGNKMRIQLGLTADSVDDFRYGFVKLNLFYGTQTVVPELGSSLLMLIGLISAAATSRRRRSV